MGSLLTETAPYCKCLAFTFGADQQEPEAFVYDTCAPSAAQSHPADITSKMLQVLVYEHAKFMHVQHSTQQESGMQLSAKCPKRSVTITCTWTLHYQQPTTAVLYKYRCIGADVCHPHCCYTIVSSIAVAIQVTWLLKSTDAP